MKASRTLNLFAALCLLALAAGIFVYAVLEHRAFEQEQQEQEQQIADLNTELQSAKAELVELKEWMLQRGLPTEPAPPPEEEGAPTSVEPQPLPQVAIAEVQIAEGPRDTVDRYFPQGYEPSIEIYLGWREQYPDGYANLIRWGNGEPPPLPIDPPMREAALIAAAGYNIDGYLAHYPRSPLNGYGQEIAYAGWRHGVNPYLLVGLAAAESTFAQDGRLSRDNHNAWGMLGPNKTGIPCVDGACWWPDWPTAFDGAAYFIEVYWPGAQTAYDLRGYCVGDPPDWIRNVEVVRQGMGGQPW